jgi:hypothetical protein
MIGCNNGEVEIFLSSNLHPSHRLQKKMHNLVSLHNQQLLND